MTMDRSDRFALPFLSSGQAQKEVTHNEALAIVDMLLQPAAESASLTEPPGSASDGQCWIVATGGSGAWTGYDGCLACLSSGGWRFVSPRAGMRVPVAEDGVVYIHNGSGWGADRVRPDGVYIEEVQVIGPRAGAIADPVGGSVTDSEARAVLAQVLVVLRGHGLIDGP